MRPLERVLWAEGMLMSPQHFQQQDDYHEALLDARLDALAPYTWGVSELAFDERALQAGQLALRAFSGVFPSGAVLRVGAEHAHTLPARSFDALLVAPKERLDVYVALPRARAGAVNYGRAELERASARYWIETRGVFDAVAPEREEALDFARPNVQLRFADEAREDLETIKIAELARDASGKPCLVPTYVPPALRLAAAPWLRTGIERVLNACLARRRVVSEALRHRDAVSVEFGADEVTRYLALSALGGAIPWLKHLLEQTAASPYQAYRALVQFAGQLSAFSADEDPSALPSYVHHDLHATFAPLFDKLLALLQLAVQTRVLTLPLEGRVDGLHIARLTAAELRLDGVRFVLAVQAPLPDHTVYELVPRVAKIAAWTEVQRYLSAAVSTVPLAASLRPPREIPLRPGKQYFTVDATAPLFQSALREQTLAVHLPPPFAPDTTHVELFAILPG